MSFTKFGLSAAIERGVADLGFTIPTPIQRDAIPPGLEGRDVLACAMTGSGKTAAFLIPIIERLLVRPTHDTIGALVVAPTRELAAQILDHFTELTRHTRLTAAAVFGGVGMQPQERAFRRGVDLMVACPGRLLDHLSRDYASLDEVEVLVLDEADRMLDMGFLPDIRRILGRLPRERQNLLFSATMPAEITRLASEILHDPVAIDVGRPSRPADGVEQSIWPVPERIKKELLLALLQRKVVANAIVFTRTKHRANRLATFLEKNGVLAERIHGNRSQAQRTRALDQFKRGRCQVLVATDIAARGIDVEALSHVVNFDIPHLPDDYIHRVGRTARAEMTGDAITFVSEIPDDQESLRAIERAIKKKLPRRTLDGFDYKGTSTERFEVPIGERIAEMRAQRARGRARRQSVAEPVAAGAGREERGGRSGDARRDEGRRDRRPDGRRGERRDDRPSRDRDDRPGRDRPRDDSRRDEPRRGPRRDDDRRPPRRDERRDDTRRDDVRRDDARRDGGPRRERRDEWRAPSRDDGQRDEGRRGGGNRQGGRRGRRGRAHVGAGATASGR